MKKQIIHSQNAPQAVGTYSQAVQVGNTVYLSGQLGINPESGELQEGFAAQAHQVFQNLQAVCQAAGGNLQDIVRLGVFLTDMQHFAEFNQIMGEYFTKPYPARAAVQVAGLPRGGMVEAEAVMVSASA
jgi:reactive intermediate/imine deaminase